MDAELKSLQIDRGQKRAAEPSKWATRWIVGGVILFLLLGIGAVSAGADTRPGFGEDDNSFPEHHNSIGGSF